MYTTETVTLHSDGLALAGQLFKPNSGNDKFPALCLCHGIPSGKKNPDDGGYPLLAQQFCEEGFVVLIFNFRGTGESGGDFDISGWTRDLQCSLDYLQSLPEVDTNNLMVMGFSAGAAVTVYTTANDNRIAAAVACACPAEFSSILDLDTHESAVDHFRQVGIIRDPAFPPSLDSWLDGFRTVTPINHVARISPRPLLLIHSYEDFVVPIEHGKRLYEKAGEPKELVLLEGDEHRLRLHTKAMERANRWLHSHLK